jgi:ribosomal protein S18 acetylase RimI-like enzyme
MCHEIKEINIHHLDLLQKFISNQLPISFRYFNHRPISIIQNHLITILYIINNEPIGYAHIDYDNENDIFWFGICILPLYHNMGIGKKMMNYIFQKNEIKNKDIYLTVDITNQYAIHLYETFHFKIISSYPSLLKMKKNKE